MGDYFLIFLVLFPILTSFLVFPLRRLGRGHRNALVVLVPAVELVGALLLLFLPVPEAGVPLICGFGLHFTAGSFRTLLAILTAFLWAMTALTCRQYFAEAQKSSRFYLFYLITLGAMMGVFLASDLYTLFIFFEIMSFTSYVRVVQTETPQALKAGSTYLAVAVIGGMALLTGLFLLYRLLGTLQIEALAEHAALLPAEKQGPLIAAGILCMIGFGAKAGIFPLHIWVPKAYVAAPAPGSALLSGILSKSGFFGIAIISLNLFAGHVNWNMALLLLAVITMVLGAVLALFSTDLKRTLACSSMSQYGFILLGISMQGLLSHENTLAAWGTVLHIMNHSLIKLVLFTAAGVVYLGAGSLDLNRVRGWGRNKPWLAVAFFIGAASIAGVPLFPGYISKTLLHESIVEYIHLLAEEGASTGLFHAVEWLFLLSGGLTFAYMTKIFVAVFVEPRANDRQPAVRNYLSVGTQTALGCGALVMMVLGLTPALTMEKIAAWGGIFLEAEPLEESLHYFSLVNLEGAAISIAIGTAVYFLFVRTVLRKSQQTEILYLNRWPKKLDLEESVYVPFLHGLTFFGTFCARVAASVGDMIVMAGEKLLFLKAPGIFVPKKNENFGAYSIKPKYSIVTETFSFDLMVSGLGVIVTLIYILLKK